VPQWLTQNWILPFEPVTGKVNQTEAESVSWCIHLKRNCDANLMTVLKQLAEMTFVNVNK